MARRWLAVVMAAGWTVLVPLLAAAQDGQDDIPELVSSRMTLDGRADDWQAIEPVVVDDDSETADHPPPGGDLHSLRLAADPDGRFVYWMIDLVDPPVGSGVLFHVVLRRDAETSLAEVFVERLVDGSLRCEVGRHRLEGPGEWEWRPVVDDPTNCAVDEIVEGRLPAWLFDNDARIGIGPFEWMATATGDGDRFEDHFQPPAGTSPDQWRFWRRLPRRSITGEVRCEGGCGEGGRLRLLAAGHLDFTAPAVAAAWLDGPGFFDLSLPMGSRLSLPMGSRVYLLGSGMPTGMARSRWGMWPASGVGPCRWAKPG